MPLDEDSLRLCDHRPDLRLPRVVNLIGGVPSRQPALRCPAPRCGVAVAEVLSRDRSHARFGIEELVNEVLDAEAAHWLLRKSRALAVVAPVRLRVGAAVNNVIKEGRADQPMAVQEV